VPFFNAVDSTAQDFSLRAWRDGAQLGEHVCYHTGNLARDRASARASVATKRVLATAAEEAWHLYLSGRVRLIQKRLSESTFAYIAVATRSAAGTNYVEHAMERSWRPRERNMSKAVGSASS
jgi:hypothetical protein